MPEFLGVELLLYPGFWFQIVAGVLLGLFGVVIASLAKFRGPAGWYALFSASFAAAGIVSVFGSSMILAHSTDLQSRFIPWGTLPTTALVAMIVSYGVYQIFNAIWIVASLRLLGYYGVKILHLPYFWGLLAIVMVARATADFFDLAGAPTWFTWTYILIIAPTVIPLAVLLCGSIELSKAWLRDRQTGQMILATAFMAYPLMYGAWILAGAGLRHRFYWMVGIMPAIALVLICVAWWRAREISNNPAAGRIPVVAVLMFVAAGFTGMFALNTEITWVARLFEILLVGYAILRLQYLDLDVKIRWGLSKSTVAAVFVAVFFIASEAAQAFFGDRLQNEYFGIAAAGALVFGIAPIMRWADRVAVTAVPGPANDAENIYRNSLRLALKDGRIDPDEEVVLGEQADSLGLTAKRMMELRAEVGS